MDEPTIKDQLLPLKKVKAETRRRMNPFDFKTTNPKLQVDYENDGWELDRVLKRSVKMRRKKTHDIAFEDRVWATIAGLGFHKLNQDRTFTLRYGNSDAETKQIDVFAADDESVLVVECKTALEAKHSSFKTDIEAIQGRRNGILKTIQKEYPGHKVKFLFATNGYDVSQPGQERIDNAKIIHLDEDAVESASRGFHEGAPSLLDVLWLTLLCHQRALDQPAARLSACRSSR